MLPPFLGELAPSDSNPLLLWNNWLLRYHLHFVIIAKVRVRVVRENMETRKTLYV